MDKLGQVTIENSVNLVVNCQVDQSLLAKNFTTLIDALKELQSAQLLSDQKIKDLLSLKERVEKIEKNSERSDSSNKEQPKQEVVVNNSDNTNSASDYENLAKRVEKNESNILDNIKDINLINGDLRDAKSDIEELKKRLSLVNQSQGKGNNNQGNGYDINDVASNLSKQLKKNEESMKDLFGRLTKAEENIQKLEEEMKRMKDRKSNDGNDGNSGNLSGVSDRQFQELKKDIKDKMGVVNQKINNIQTDVNHHDQEIGYLKDILENQGDKEGQDNKNSGNVNSDKIATNLAELKKKLESVDSREKKDFKYLEDEINKLKDQLKTLKAERNQEDFSHSKKSTIKTKDLDDFSDKLNDLTLKVTYLEKLMAGSKNSLDDKNPQKLPSINRPVRKREGNLTMYHDKNHDKSGFGRRDLAQLKAQLENWLRNLLDSLQSRENMESMDLKIQEIKRALDRKADAEGTKKGFAFLENKITQLYLFLTEPETEDAMIVRKGFNCLSCSKKVEKLRGKLGPRINWNNMTNTNYSPPRVGYSKPNGEKSIDRQDDL